MIPLLNMKTADTAHMGIFASDTSPVSQFFGWGLGTKLHMLGTRR